MSALRNLSIITLIFVSALSLAGFATVPIASSTFDSDADGWEVISTLGYVGPVTYSAIDGNPGGFIYATDPDTGAWGFSAPSKFLIGAASAYGGELSFDIAAIGATGSQSWVGISGAGLEFVHAFAVPTLDYPVWYNHTIGLVETAGWFDPTTLNAPTQVQMQTILANLDFLVIDAEFANGPDIAGIDKVVLVPEPSLMLLLLLVTGVFRRK